MSLRPTIIYGMIDPRSKELRYVGKTTRTLLKRLKAHIVRTNLTPTRHSSRWLAGIVADGLLPDIFEIETVEPGGDWASSEQFWISYFRFLGADLTNITDGGEGVAGYVFPEDRKRALSEKFKGRKFDDEWRAKISKSKRGIPTGIKPKAETTAKRIASLLSTLRKKSELLTHCKNGHPLESGRCRICRKEKSRAYWLKVKRPDRTPEELATIRKEVANRPSFLAVQSARMKRQMADPEFRAKAKAARKLVKAKSRAGEKHPQAKLTWPQVDEIRSRCASGEIRRIVGLDYGVAVTTVDQIIQGRCWKIESRPAP